MTMIVPKHVAIIMDGNGRWATEKGLLRSEGHLEGSKVIMKIAEHAFDMGVKILSVFAFSTENFKRSKEEVDYLMDLFTEFFTRELNRMKEKDIKVIFSGRKDRLPEELLKVMEKDERETANNKHGILNVCLNYGGHSEIVDAVKKIIKNKVDIDSIDEESFKSYLYYNLPDIDLVIRTSGEQRISNFMPYQLAYAELYFPITYWPAFGEKDFDLAIEEFNKRTRRFGNA